ncbi:hypothetical protein HYW54_04990 [Candidatus Gottesmanbacteria bacterium]|nr:hypothetical protein [Candidatus Gottesmanbacteria bacterium]
MLPHDKRIIWVVILVIVVGVVILSSIYLSSQFSKNINISSKNFSSQRLFPTDIVSKINSNFKILYQDPADTEGRTIIYDIPGETKPSLLKSSGLVYARGTNHILYAVGLFKEWESIEGTKDRYILLRDPFSKGKLPKFRVAYEPSQLYDGKENMTSLSRENIEKIVEGKKHISLVARSFSDLSQTQIDELFRKGDAVAVLSLWGENDKSARRDENDQLLSGWVYIRRN